MQQVLLDAALLGRRIHPSLVAAVGRVSTATVDETVAAAANVLLLRIDEFGVRFRHA